MLVQLRIAQRSKNVISVAPPCLQQITNNNCNKNNKFRNKVTLGIRSYPPDDMKNIENLENLIAKIKRWFLQQKTFLWHPLCYTKVLCEGCAFTDNLARIPNIKA